MYRSPPLRSRCSRLRPDAAGDGVGGAGELAAGAGVGGRSPPRLGLRPPLRSPYAWSPPSVFGSEGGVRMFAALGEDEFVGDVARGRGAGGDELAGDFARGRGAEGACLGAGAAVRLPFPTDDARGHGAGSVCLGGPIMLLSPALPAPWVWRWSPNLRSDESTPAERLVVSGSKALPALNKCKNSKQNHDNSRAVPQCHDCSTSYHTHHTHPAANPSVSSAVSPSHSSFIPTRQ